ncbi:unnamed protein product, partial [Didymodactylos carnosus]
MIVCGSIRIYWNIHSQIQLKSGRSIPLGLYPKSIGIFDLNHQELKSNETSDMENFQQKNLDSPFKSPSFDDIALLTRLSLDDMNLRRSQTIKLPSSRRKTYGILFPTFMSTNDDEESRSFIPATDSMTTIYISSSTTSIEAIHTLFEKHYIETNSSLFSLYKVEKLNGNIFELNDDDFPLLLRILSGPFNDTQFYIMEKGR